LQGAVSNHPIGRLSALQDAMLREFQEEIARLKAELAAKQAGKAKGPSATATPEASPC